MEILQALVLGVVQGLTEFIPVSSSGHLILVGELLEFEYSTLGFDMALNIGTLTALFLFFRGELFQLGLALFRKSEQTKLAWVIVAATVPAVVVGILLQSYAETTFRSSTLVAVNLILVAFVMLAADRFAREKIDLGKMTFSRGLAIGAAQAIALIPGVSRSGITISAGLFAGLNPVAATKFSFLLSAPVILGATLKVLIDPANSAELTAEPLLYMAGVIGAAVSGYIAIRFMLKYLARHGLAIFAYYRIAVGIIILAMGTGS